MRRIDRNCVLGAEPVGHALLGLEHAFGAWADHQLGICICGGVVTGDTFMQDFNGGPATFRKHDVLEPVAGFGNALQGGRDDQRSLLLGFFVHCRSGLLLGLPGFGVGVRITGRACINRYACVHGCLQKIASARLAEGRNARYAGPDHSIAPRAGALDGKTILTTSCVAFTFRYI